MVSSCCVKGCSEKFVKGGGVSYFRISSKPEMQRNAWILALKRNGWTPKAHHRICSRHFVTGTWNSDPNHIDYIPTRGMSRDMCYADAIANSDSLDAPLQEHSLAPDSPNTTDMSSLISYTNGSFPSPHPNMDDSFTSSPQSGQMSSTRVPIMGVSTKQFSGTSSTSHRRKPRKTPRKHLEKWSSSPKLTSSHFCEHQDSHRNCCRVIRELAEENQILKSQVTCLLYEMDKLRAQSTTVSNHRTPASDAILHTPVPQLLMNGKDEILHDNLQDIEVVSESPPSLGINEDAGFPPDEILEEDGQ